MNFFRVSGIAYFQFRYVRFLIAAILLTAAGLKAYQLATVPILGEGLLHARWFNLVVVNFEILFGLWLLYGLLPKFTWLCSVVAFVLFTLVSLAKGFAGEVSCGCFGNIVVNPWHTAVFDAATVFLLMLCCPSDTKYSLKFAAEQKLLLQSVCSGFVSVAVILTPINWLVLTYQPSVLTDDGQILGTASTVMLYPQEWIGKPFPLQQYIDLPADVKQGDWVVILYGADCSKCKAHFDRFQRDGFPKEIRTENIAFLEIAGRMENDIKRQWNVGRPVWGCLTAERQWFADLPVVLLLEEGIVKQVVDLSEDF